MVHHSRHALLITAAMSIGAHRALALPMQTSLTGSSFASSQNRDSGLDKCTSEVDSFLDATNVPHCQGVRLTSFTGDYHPSFAADDKLEYSIVTDTLFKAEEDVFTLSVDATNHAPSTVHLTRRAGNDASPTHDFSKLSTGFIKSTLTKAGALANGAFGQVRNTSPAKQIGKQEGLNTAALKKEVDSEGRFKSDN